MGGITSVLLLSDRPDRPNWGLEWYHTTICTIHTHGSTRLKWQPCSASSQLGAPCPVCKYHHSRGNNSRPTGDPLPDLVCTSFQRQPIDTAHHVVRLASTQGTQTLTEPQAIFEGLLSSTSLSHLCCCDRSEDTRPFSQCYSASLHFKLLGAASASFPFNAHATSILAPSFMG